MLEGLVMFLVLSQGGNLEDFVGFLAGVEKFAVECTVFGQHVRTRGFQWGLQEVHFAEEFVCLLFEFALIESDASIFECFDPQTFQFFDDVLLRLDSLFFLTKSLFQKFRSFVEIALFVLILFFYTSSLLSGVGKNL